MLQRFLIIPGLLFALATSAIAAEYECDLAIFNDQQLPISYQDKSGDPSRAEVSMVLPEGFAAVAKQGVIGTDTFVVLTLSKGSAETSALFDPNQQHLFLSLKADGVRAQVQCTQGATSTSGPTR